MQRRVIRRAMASAMILFVMGTATAFAESVTADADVFTTGDQDTFDLGGVAPGQDVGVDVEFRLDCSGTSHVDAGQSVRLSPGTRTIPTGGSFAGFSTVNLTPGVGWPADGAACPAGLPAVTVVRRITVSAPLTPGTDLRYVFSWNRSLVPTTAGDADVLEGSNPTVTFILDAVDNTPPSLHLPADSTVEGDTTGGAIAAYTVSASDAEDATAPTPACDPPVGDLLPLGTTTVSCSATDSGGLTTTGSFDITVVDTTAPDARRDAGRPIAHDRRCGRRHRDLLAADRDGRGRPGSGRRLLADEREPVPRRPHLGDMHGHGRHRQQLERFVLGRRDLHRAGRLVGALG